MTAWHVIPLAALAVDPELQIMVIHDGQFDYHFTLSGKLELQAHELAQSIDESSAADDSWIETYGNDDMDDIPF